MSAGVTKLITESEIKSSMSDPAFYDKMPEFLPLRVKMRTMRADLTVKKGCTACAQRRVYSSLAGNYLQTLESLSADGVSRLKEYFGAESLRATRIDPVTRSPKTIRL